MSLKETGSAPLKIEQKTINKINKIIESKKPGTVTIKGVKVRIDPVQNLLNETTSITDEKTGGILPLVALIPLIAKAVAAAGALTGGVATAVKVGTDIAKGGGAGGPVGGGVSTLTSLDITDQERKPQPQKPQNPPCKSKVIDAILTLHEAGFTLMRM